MVGSSVYMGVTYKQISDMKHAIGFDNRKVRGTKYRKFESCRNFYNAGCPEDFKSWDHLVSIGFAEKNGSCYRVTADGKCFLGYVTDVGII